jgi:hypothetical protein
MKNSKTFSLLALSTLTKTDPIPLTNDAIDPPPFIPKTRHIEVNGRKEHESIIKDTDKCRELGVDQMYEIMVYLHRWGSWLEDE